MPNVFSQSCHHNLLLFITKSGCSGHLQLSYCTRKYFVCQMLSKFHNTVRPLLCKTVAPCIRQTKPYVAQKIMSHTGHVVQEIAQKSFLLFLNRPCKWWTPLILFRQQLFRKQKPQVLKSWSLTFCSLYQKEDPHSSVWTFEVLVKPFSFMPSKLNMLFSLDKLHKVHSNHDSRQILILICDTLITFSTVWHLCVPDVAQM